MRSVVDSHVWYGDYKINVLRFVEGPEEKERLAYYRASTFCKQHGGTPVRMSGQHNTDKDKAVTEVKKAIDKHLSEKH